MMTNGTHPLLREIADTALLLASGREDAARDLEELISEAEALGFRFFDPDFDPIDNSGSHGLPF